MDSFMDASVFVWEKKEETKDRVLLSEQFMKKSSNPKLAAISVLTVSVVALSSDFIVHIIHS